MKQNHYKSVTHLSIYLENGFTKNSKIAISDSLQPMHEVQFYLNIYPFKFPKKITATYLN